MKTIRLTLLTSGALLAPMFVFSAPRNFADVVNWVADFAALLVPVIIGITFVFIIWGMAKAWIIDGGSEESTQTGKMVFLTGVIGLTVMIGMWGLISLVRSAIFF